METQVLNEGEPTDQYSFLQFHKIEDDDEKYNFLDQKQYDEQAFDIFSKEKSQFNLSYAGMTPFNNDVRFDPNMLLQNQTLENERSNGYDQFRYQQNFLNKISRHQNAFTTITPNNQPSLLNQMIPKARDFRNLKSVLDTQKKSAYAVNNYQVNQPKLFTNFGLQNSAKTREPKKQILINSISQPPQMKPNTSKNTNRKSSVGQQKQNNQTITVERVNGKTFLVAQDNKERHLSNPRNKKEKSKSFQVPPLSQANKRIQRGPEQIVSIVTLTEQASDTNSSNGKKVAEIESILAGVVNAYAELRKGESGAGSSSDEEEVKDHVQLAPGDDVLPRELLEEEKEEKIKMPTLDLDQLQIDQQQLINLTFSSSRQPAPEQPSGRKQKQQDFEDQIKSIIGNINKKTNLFKSQLTGKNDSQIIQNERISIELSGRGRDSLSYSELSKDSDFKRSSVQNNSQIPNQLYQDPLKEIQAILHMETYNLDETVDDRGKESNLNVDEFFLEADLDDISSDNISTIKCDYKNENNQIHELDELEKTKLLKDQLNVFSDEKLKSETSEKIKKEEVSHLLSTLKTKHQADLMAILTEQNIYKRLVKTLVDRLKQKEKEVSQLKGKIFEYQKGEKLVEMLEQNQIQMQAELDFNREKYDKMKIVLFDYDRYIRESALNEQEFYIQQLETENSHLRKLLFIPQDLFEEDADEKKMKEVNKKKTMMKSIDEKLKAAEKKLQRKQSMQDIQNKNNVEQFELDNEEYDMYKLAKLREIEEMPKEIKGQLSQKIYSKVEERNMREEMRKQEEKEILQEFAKAYGYDINKHQPHNNNGEIMVECLQAYIAECRQKEEQLAKEKDLVKQKEALKGKLSAGLGSKKNKKQLQVETEGQTFQEKEEKKTDKQITLN